MQRKNRMKLLSTFIGVILFTSAIQTYALGNSLSGPADISQGSQQWGHQCSRCHNFRSATEFDAKKWQTILLHMRIQAGISGQESRNIYAFLSAQSAKVPEIISSAHAESYEITFDHSIQKAKLPASKQTTTNKDQEAAKKSSPTPSSHSGKTIYQQTCIVCHGGNGKGAIPGVPDFTSSNSPLKNSDAVLLDRAIKGYQTPGSPMAMPPRGGNPKLTDNDLKQALGYIRKTFSK